MLIYRNRGSTLQASVSTQQVFQILQSPLALTFPLTSPDLIMSSDQSFAELSLLLFLQVMYDMAQ
jgi:hypothetical protein